jgi:ribosomal protein S18 acetylase RimI-like enzyme
MHTAPQDTSLPRIAVRAATTADEPAVAAVIASADAALRETYQPNQNALDHKRRLSPSLTRLVALIDDRVVGTVQYTTDADNLHVIGLSVHHDHRRRGVARALVAELVAIARASGAAGLALHTIGETGNVPIFERLGFRVVAERRDRFAKGDRCVGLTDVEMHHIVAHDG